MKKLTQFLLFAALLFVKYTSAQTCVVDREINLKINEGIDSKVRSLLMKAQLDCQTVTTRGADATCPLGFIPTGCSCGMACGSWDIRGNSVCHCQCANIDWTSSRCCKISIAG